MNMEGQTVSIKDGKLNIHKQGLPVKKSFGNPETSQTGMVSVSNNLGYDTTRVHFVDWLVIANMSCHRNAWDNWWHMIYIINKNGNYADSMHMNQIGGTLLYFLHT